MIFEREAGAAYSASAVSHKSIVYPVRTYTECDLQGVFGRVYRYHTRGIFSGRTDIAEASGTGIEVVLNLPKTRVSVVKSYRTYRSVGCRY